MSQAALELWFTKNLGFEDLPQRFKLTRAVNEKIVYPAKDTVKAKITKIKENAKSKRKE